MTYVPLAYLIMQHLFRGRHRWVELNVIWKIVTKIICWSGRLADAKGYRQAGDDDHGEVSDMLSHVSPLLNAYYIMVNTLTDQSELH